MQHLCSKFGIQRVGFLTLTFRDHILCPKESQRRYNSLRTHVLAHRYAAHIRVFERQKSGRIHYHLLVVLPVDIRSGFDFDAAARRDYSSASPALRDEWAFWRSTAPLYGFGRTELLPVKSTSEGIGRYVGKYIGKHIAVRPESDKGVRLVAYSKSARVANPNFSWCTEGGAQWRLGVSRLASLASARGLPVQSYDDLRRVLGPRWAWRHRDLIGELANESEN